MAENNFDPKAYLADDAANFDPHAYLGTAPEEKPGFFKRLGKDLYQNAPEIVGNTLGSMAAAPVALAAGAVNPAAGFAVESAGAGLGQGIGSLAKSAVQNGTNLAQNIIGHPESFPDAPSSTGDIFKKAGVETLKGAATPAIGKVVGVAAKGLGKGAALAGEALTGKPAEEIEAIFHNPKIFTSTADKAKALYDEAKFRLNMPKNDLMTMAERASSPGKTAEYSAQEIANPVISAINNNVPVDASTLIGGKEAIGDLLKSSPRGSSTRAAYSEAMTKVNNMLDDMATHDSGVGAFRAADKEYANSKIGENFKQVFPDVSLNKASLGKMLGSNALIAGAAHASPLGLAMLPFESPAVTGATAAVTGLAKKGVDKALAVPGISNTLRAAISKLLMK